MKSLKFVSFMALAALTVGLMTPQTSAQSDLFGKYNVTMTSWAKLDPAVPWGGETSMVAVDGKGHVVVIVRTAPHIRVFNTDGTFVKAWGDAGTFGMAHSVHFDKEGNMWVADPTWHVVQKFNAEGKIVMTLGKKQQAGDNASKDAFNQPNFVTFNNEGHIFVSDGYQNSRIVEFTKDGQFVRIFGGVKGNKPGELQLPHGVAIDSKGRVLVSDSDNKRVSVFDKDGKFVEIWDVPCRGSIAVAADDTVYTSDVNAGSVIISKEGRILNTVKVDGRPHGMALDLTNGDIYTTSSVKESPNVTKAVLKTAAEYNSTGRGAAPAGRATGAAAPAGGASRGAGGVAAPGGAPRGAGGGAPRGPGGAAGPRGAGGAPPQG